MGGHYSVPADLILIFLNKHYHQKMSKLLKTSSRFVYFSISWMENIYTMFINDLKIPRLEKTNEWTVWDRVGGTRLLPMMSFCFIVCLCFFFPPVTAQSICNETNTAFSHKENWEPNVEVFLYPSNISHLLIQIKSNSHLRPDPFRLSIKPISKHDKNFNLQEEATESRCKI